jgi:ABC-type molybdate transport system substrate-binding protein
MAASSNRAEAQRVLAFLQGPAASAIFARHGFLPLSGREHRP